MEYFKNNEITIRDMQISDAEIFTEEEIKQGWIDATTEKIENRIKDVAYGKAISIVAEYLGNPAGYVSVYINSDWGSLGGKGYSEIIDFAVLEKYRCKGVGTTLMDIAEKIAFKYSDTVYLGVGLHNGYGSAQRMYIKRGYIPDGMGVWYGDKVCEQYADCKNDDDLNLYLYKTKERTEV